MREKQYISFDKFFNIFSKDFLIFTIFDIHFEFNIKKDINNL
jgi:hypothetical protein